MNEKEDRKNNLLGDDYEGRLTKEDIAGMHDVDLGDGISRNLGVIGGVLELLFLADWADVNPKTLSFLLDATEKRVEILRAYAEELWERFQQAQQAKAA